LEKKFRSKAPKGYIGGHFRANWQIGVGVRPMNEIDGVDKTGEATQAAIYAAIPMSVLGHTYYLVNNVPYAQRLEDGWSWHQAPQGMVHLAIMEYQRIVNDAIKSAKK
jgi:hypothetical protein